MKFIDYIFLSGAILIALGSSQLANAQCNNYQNSVTPSPLPDNCPLTTALNLAPLVGSCQTICINTALATVGTGSSQPTPSCGSGTVTNDVWGYVQDPYNSIPSYDGSLVLSWKKYPSFPNNTPTLAAHLDINGTLYIGTPPFTIPIAQSINCTDGFLAANLVCASSTDPNYDNSVILPAGTLPTNAGIEQIIEANPSPAVSNAVVNNSCIWFQIETYNNAPGLICFEVSKYTAGFSCGDPAVITFPNTGTSQTQNVSACLCNSAANSGYFSLTNQPCTPPANGINVGTTAYYEINAPYTYNQISVQLNSWAGAGDLNVAILSNMVCPDVVDTINGVPTPRPGWVVNSATALAASCLNMGSNTVSTAASNLLPAGTYYVLVSGNTDKDTFGASITVSQLTAGVTVQARAFLEGAFIAPSSMSTTLRTANNLPLTQPYNRLPWNYAGTESVATASAIPTNAVDWVLLEAHTAAGALVETRAAFLLNNGAIVDADGITNGVRFLSITSGNSYKFVIRHRNHLDVAGINTVAVPNATPYNFADPTQVVSGNQQLTPLTGSTLYGLRAGDTTGGGVISFADFNKYRSLVGTATPYSDGDCNLNGTVAGDDFTVMQPNFKLIAVPNTRLE